MGNSKGRNNLTSKLPSFKAMIIFVAHLAGKAVMAGNLFNKCVIFRLVQHVDSNPFTCISLKLMMDFTQQSSVILWGFIYMTKYLYCIKQLFSDPTQMYGMNKFFLFNFWKLVVFDSSNTTSHDDIMMMCITIEISRVESTHCLCCTWSTSCI